MDDIHGFPGPDDENGASEGHATKEPFISVSREPSSPVTSMPIDWAPGFWKRVPWKGFCALAGAGLCIAAWVAILVVSAGKQVNAWTLQPAVYLAIVVAVANILIHFAFAEGATFFWWRRALRHDSTFGDLHRDWQYSNSFLAAARSGRDVSVIAIATLLVAIVPINGPVLQRASRPMVVPLTTSTTLTFDASPQVPNGYTSILTGEDLQPSVLSNNFSRIVGDFANRVDITMEDSGCQGTCVDAHLVGAGFAVNCTMSTIHWNFTKPASGGSLGDFPGAQVFQSDFYYFIDAYNQVDIGAQYKQGYTCSGDMIVRNCTLRAALVQYPVVVDGNRSVISLAPDTTIADDVVQSVLPQPRLDLPFPGQGSTLGGFALALSNQYQSTASFGWSDVFGSDFKSSGALVNQNIVGNNYTGQGTDCAVSFSDPTDTLLAAARELMFRTAIHTANGTGAHTSPAADTIQAIVWESHYGYLAGAAVLTVVAMAAVLPAFHRFWILGRHVSMSPLEVAKAFEAPLLAASPSNSTADDIMKTQARRAATYGMSRTGSMRFLSAAERSQSLDI